MTKQQLYLRSESVVGAGGRPRSAAKDQTAVDSCGVWLNVGPIGCLGLGFASNLGRQGKGGASRELRPASTSTRDPATAGPLLRPVPRIPLKSPGCVLGQTLQPSLATPLPNPSPRAFCEDLQQARDQLLSFAQNFTSNSKHGQSLRSLPCYRNNPAVDRIIGLQPYWDVRS